MNHKKLTALAFFAVLFATTVIAAGASVLTITLGVLAAVVLMALAVRAAARVFDRAVKGEPPQQEDDQ